MRIYAPHLGRFLQTDPIGYADSPNLYAYVLGDPVNLVDPLGLQSEQEEILVKGVARRIDPILTTGALFMSAFFDMVSAADKGDGPVDEEIVVTGKRKKSPPPPPPLPPGIVKTVPTFRLAAAAIEGVDICGSPGNSQYVPEGIGATSFQGPCRKHDDCYGTLGKTQEQCDQGLGRDVLNECKRTGGSFCALASYIYYKTLSVTGLGFGTQAFQDAQRQARAARR